MAKDKKGGSARIVSPLYESGRMNGPVAGPTHGEHPNDPGGYLTRSGKPAPSGSMTNREAENVSRGGRDQSPDKGSS